MHEDRTACVWYPLHFLIHTTLRLRVCMHGRVMLIYSSVSVRPFSLHLSDNIYTFLNNFYTTTLYDVCSTEDLTNTECWLELNTVLTISILLKILTANNRLLVFSGS